MNLNFFKNNNKSKKFIIMTIIYKILHVLSGFDYGFFHFESVFGKFLVKLSSLVVFITISYVTCDNYIMDQNIWNYTWFILFFAKYATCFLFLLFLKSNKSLRSFHDDLYSIDSKFGVDSASFNMEIKFLCTSFVFANFRIFVGSLYCVADTCVVPIVSLIYIILVTCIDIVLISYSFVFFAVNCRLKKLSSVLEKTESGFSVLLAIYKLYVDIVEKYKRAFDPMLVITLCLTVPEVMFTIYFTVEELQYHRMSLNIMVLCMEYIVIINTLMTTFAPAICASMLSTQADQIIVVLHDKLLKQRDEAQMREIERLIEYVSARNCRFRVCKVIPLDADLIGMVLGFCVTYLIVIIQFINSK